MKSASLAVIILNWNGKQWLEQFLPSVLQHNSYEGSVIYVADNASTDDSVEYVSNNFPEVRLLLNNENNGYAGGYNFAINQVQEEYICLLNSDIEVTSNWIEPIMNMFLDNPQIGAIQPKIRSFYQKDYFEYAGAAGGFIDWLGYPCTRGRIFDQAEIDEGQYNDSCEIFWASGACLFVNRAKYLEAGALDTSLFAHQEEIDLCWRMKNLGYRIYYNANSMVYHVGGGSLPYGNTRKTFLNFRNNLIVILKNYPFPKLILVLLLRAFLDVLAAFYSIVKTKKMGDFFAILKADMSFMARIPSIMVERKKMKAHLYHPEILSKSLIINFYLLNKKKFSEIFK